MGDLKDEFRGKGVEFVAINVQEDVDRANAFVADSGMDYTWLRAVDGEARAAGITAIPALIVLDESGTVVWRSSMLSLIRGAEVLRPVLDELTSG